MFIRLLNLFTLKTTETSFIAGWKQHTKKYLFWILGINAFIISVEIITILMNSYPLMESLFSKPVVISNLSPLLIPLVAVNTLFLAKQIWKGYKRRPFSWFMVKMLGACIGVIIGTGCLELLSYIWGISDDDFIVLGELEFSAAQSNFIENIVVTCMIGIPIFYKESVTEKIEHTLKRKEEELEKVYKLKVQSELAAIHAKINPHFLYNALNSIVSLIHHDPEKAEKMVLSLSDLFRYSINSSENHFATIREEIFLVETYLQIEHVRFQDQLRYEIHVSEDLQAIKIPKFLIQPLIENAIKHGTSHITQGFIKLDISQQKDGLRIAVFDNGPDFQEDMDSGYGLKSTVDKLELLYKDNYSLKIVNKPEKCIEIHLKNTSYEG